MLEKVTKSQYQVIRVFLLIVLVALNLIKAPYILGIIPLTLYIFIFLAETHIYEESKFSFRFIISLIAFIIMSALLVFYIYY